MSYLLPPDEPRTKTCPDCFGAGNSKDIFDWEGEPEICHTCDGTGEIIIDEDFDEVKADDERHLDNNTNNPYSHPDTI